MLTLDVADRVSGFSHLLGALVALVAAIDLIRRGGASRERVGALVVYVVGVVALLTASGVYHLTSADSPHRAPLQRIDHAAIWVQIAGTFTPIHIVFFRGFWRVFPLLVVWGGAAAGILLKLVFFDAVPEALGTFLYLGLGWFGVVSCGLLTHGHGWRVIIPMAVGGVLYSGGALLELNRWVNPLPGVVGPHELFHFAVLGGIFSHWVFIRRWAGGLEPAPAAAQVDGAALPLAA